MALNSRQKNTAPGNTMLWIIIGVVVLGAAAIAIGMSAGKGSGDPDNGTVAAEYQPVTVSNPALPPLGDGTSADAAIGQQAPALQGANFAGNAMSIAPGSNGNPTMLVFLAHWCPHCNREIPRLIDWKERGLVPTDLRVVGITTASRSDQANWPPSQWITDMEWPWEVMADSETADAANAYGVDGYPMIVVIGADGKVKLRFSGEREVSELTTLINGALA